LLTSLSGSKRDEVAGGWKILHKEELHNLWTSQNKIRIINSARTRTAEQVACIENMRNVSIFLIETRRK
jgi:hypothetical protein